MCGCGKHDLPSVFSTVLCIRTPVVYFIHAIIPAIVKLTEHKMIIGTVSDGFCSKMIATVALTQIPNAEKMKSHATRIVALQSTLSVFISVTLTQKDLDLLSLCQEYFEPAEPQNLHRTMTDVQASRKALKANPNEAGLLPRKAKANAATAMRMFIIIESQETMTAIRPHRLATCGVNLYSSPNMSWSSIAEIH